MLKSEKKKTKSTTRRGKLVIVESPAKARTIGRYLGRGYTVKASMGHVRDLPNRELGFDPDRDFEPVYQVPDEVVDVSFAIRCPTIPLDHAHALSAELLAVMPWLAEEAGAGVHLIHGAASGNGWFRPEDPGNEVLHLSRRTRMRLRIPQHRLDDARLLSGKTLDIDGHALELGKTEVFLLSSLSTLFARYVICREEDDEEEEFVKSLPFRVEILSSSAAATPPSTGPTPWHRRDQRSSSSRAWARSRSGRDPAPTA